MKAKDLEQGKYYSTVEFSSNGDVLRQRWWYITLREDKNIRAMVVEKIRDNPLSFYSDFEVWYSDRLDNDISSAVIAFAYGLSAQIERQLISQRTKEASARKKAEGVFIGSPKGSLSKKLNLQVRRKIYKNI